MKKIMVIVAILFLISCKCVAQDKNVAQQHWIDNAKQITSSGGKWNIWSIKIDGCDYYLCQNSGSTMIHSASCLNPTHVWNEKTTKDVFKEYYDRDK